MFPSESDRNITAMHNRVQKLIERYQEILSQKTRVAYSKKKGIIVELISLHFEYGRGYSCNASALQFVVDVATESNGSEQELSISEDDDRVKDFAREQLYTTVFFPVSKVAATLADEGRMNVLVPFLANPFHARLTAGKNIFSICREYLMSIGIEYYYWPRDSQAYRQAKINFAVWDGVRDSTLRELVDAVCAIESKTLLFTDDEVGVPSEKVASVVVLANSAKRDLPLHAEKILELVGKM